MWTAQSKYQCNEVTKAPLALKKFPAELQTMILQATLVRKTPGLPTGENDDVFDALFGDSELYKIVLDIVSSRRIYTVDGGDTQEFLRGKPQIQELHSQ